MSTKGKPITIFKGDDTNAFGLRTISINLSGDLDLRNAFASFNLFGYEKCWTMAEVSTGKMTMVMTSSDTSKFPLGPAFGTLRLYDQAKALTITNKIPFLITNCVDGVHVEEYDIHVTLAVDTEIDIKFVMDTSIDGAWMPNDTDTALVPRKPSIQRIGVPALANVSEIGPRYTLADVRNLANAILAALKE